MSNEGRAGVNRRGRIYWVVCFALLLLAVAAAPVFGAGSPEGNQTEPSLSEIPAPSAAELAPAEAEQREAAEWLSSPEAQEEREASRSAYASLSAGEAESLLLEAFPKQLEELNADPGRVLSNLEVEKPLGTYGALVSAEGGETALLNSSVPVQSDLGGEGEQPVDLALEESGGAYVPQNPVTEVQLPGSAEDRVQLEGGVEVALPTSNDHGAEPVGEMNLFYPETETATDTFLAPRAGGVEVFEQLRSPQSPEQFSFDLALPAGATLRPSEAGGAEIISSSGEQIDEVLPASATDAQGAAVPVTTSVEGSTLVLEVPHTSREVAYPLLLDPSFVNDTTSFGEWTPSLNSGYQYYLDNNGSSLDAKSRGSSYFYGAGSHGQWAYGAYGQTSYIAAATFSPNFFLINNCQTYEPHGYIGLWNPGANKYDALGVYANAKVENSTYETGWNGNTGTKAAIIGIGTDSNVALACAHELYVGGYTIQEEDPEAPTVTSVGGIPSGWAREPTITPHASDPGLGVKAITLSPEGSLPNTKPQGCTGANGSRCPGSWETSFGGSYFAEGERSASASAYDPLGPDVASHVSGSYQFTTRVDRQKPEVKLEGEFTEALKEAEKEGEGKNAPALHLPVYNLKIEATDKANEGNPQTEAKARRSGVKNIKVFLEGKELKVPWSPQECSGPYYSCPMSETFPVPLDEVQGGGVHKLKVIAIDQVGNEREEELSFEYFPATGIEDEYVMQRFPLPDGEGNEAEEEEPKRPELAVNVADGNLVFRQRDVEVTGPAADLEVERFYNSELPSEDSTEWGKGWTLGQTPKLEPEEAGEAPKKAALVGTSGTVTRAVSLPTESGGERFDPKLQAVVRKVAGGGYTIADRSGETDGTMAFNQANKMTELHTPGSALVKYSYEAGNLSKIAVDDPGTAGSSIRTAAEAEEERHLAEPSYRSSFGAAGSGNGQLKHPADVAVDAKGNLWVVDKEGNRIEEFNEAGEFLRAAGSLGSGAGQLNAPSGVAMDSSGNVDVTDTANNRVVRFNEKGEFVSAIGANVNKTKVEAGGTLAEKNHCTASSGNVCQAGTTGSAEGLMAEPIGITTTSGGNFLVVEKADNRVEKFNTNGELLAKFGTSTTEGHQLKEPTAITGAPNGSGYFWVADTGNNRIEEWTSSFAFVRAVGSEGSGNGQFKHPDAIEADAEGNVYVADKGNGRVQELNSSGEYLSKLGSSGSGATQFSLSDPAGLTVDNKGNIWLTDPGNNRIERWLAPYNPVYASQLGAAGSGSGQFKHPADVAVDAKGNLWVVDKEGNRIEEFNEAGEFLRAAGSLGSGAGQLSSPSGVAMDSFGNVDVTDTANNRVVRFNEKGEFVSAIGANVNKTKVEAGGTLAEKNHCTASSGNVCQAGSTGSAEGLMAEPVGITTSGGGNFLVVEKADSRVEKFNTNGELLAHFGSLGPGEGQLKEPTAIAAAPNGYLWVADTGNNRIEEWTSSYAYKRTVGKEGTANGEFKHPDAVETDAEGNVYVADQGNGRVQELSEAGKYLSRFGSSGSGAGQLSLSDPAGLAVEAKGSIWVTDPGNNRLERWMARSTAPSAATAPVEPDPAVAVKTSSGLVTSVEGEGAGTTTYTHQGQLLTAAAGPKGKTEYANDSQGRLTKVTLPNGTWGEVKYDAYGRVESVSVSVKGGKAKTTTFQYKAEPRRTTVSTEGEPTTVYDIAADGSVLKWWYTATRPEIENLSGSLYANKETAAAIAPGDYELLTQAFSNQGIASIQVVANGNQLVDEKTCTITETTTCKTVEDPWVTNTGNWSPGILQLEVIVTAYGGATESSRFWVNIPYTSPPNPEAPEPPTFEEVLQFREQFGLDLDLKGNEIAIDERIFNLIGDWYNPQTPAGEVARATRENWGVPLRSVDAAEMEYRESYINQASSAIPQWVGANGAASAYAGYYVDHRAGGIIYVGFTSEPEQRLASLKGSGGLIAPDRVRPFPVQPTHTMAYLESLDLEVASVSGAPAAMGGARVNIQLNRVDVGAANVAEVEAFLSSHFVGAPIHVYYQAVGERPQFARTRSDQTGPIKAADMIGSLRPGEPNQYEEACSAGWGAWDSGGVNPDGSTLYRFFITTAGHCFTPGTEVDAMELTKKEEVIWHRSLGFVRRYSFNVKPSGYATDAEAIRVEDPSIVPRLIRLSGSEFKRINGSTSVKEGMVVCRSGAFSPEVRCGAAELPPDCERWNPLHENGNPILCTISVEIPIQSGDSGGPYWERATGKAVGTLTGGVSNVPGVLHGESWFTPVEEVPGYPAAPGSLAALGLEGQPLHIVKWKP